MTTTDAASLATSYIQAVGRHELDALDSLFSEDLTALMGGRTFIREEWLQALRRLMPALVRNDIRHVSADESTACVVYDFVTETAAGAVPCVEVVGVADGRIHSIELIFDRVTFAPVNEALALRVEGA